MSDPDDHGADLALAHDLCDAADTITMARFCAQDLQVATKPDLTPVTDADRGVETAVRDLVAARRPDDGVLGEEYPESRGSGGRRWVIDPIDGTKNYVRGVPVWATVLGLQDSAGQVVVGVVSAPALARRWWAVRGGGAWLREPGRAAPRRLAVSAVADLADAFLSGSSQLSWAQCGRGAQWDRLQAAVWRTRAFGDFWSHLLVAEGALDLAAEPELNLYDVAGVSLVVTEAGGRFTGLDGVDGPDRGSGVASNGLLHSAALALLSG
ncbi:MAG TPA: histidinol-phosphatase [Candidatus Nanopelagicales bacterium]|nr:histidinol-phosphatase [Candidatus Nanopelagicales bacterium]